MASLTVDDPRRLDLALFASWELEAISTALIEAAQSLEVRDLAIRGLSIRAQELSRVIMSALHDDLDPTEEIAARLTGLRAVAESSRG